MDDQPRPPDLDAAIDATVRSLTAVSDDAAADSLRRTRIALAEAAPAAGGFGTWRWVVPVAALIVAALVARAWWPGSTPDAPRIAVVDERPRPAATAPAPSPSMQTTPAIPVAPAPAAQTRRLATSRVAATSAPAVEDRRPIEDPLIALTRAVQEIPEDAWSAMARAQEPLATPELETGPIVVPPLVTPPIADAPAEPLAEGDR
jgi:hypothetical protein